MVKELNSLAQDLPYKKLLSTLTILVSVCIKRIPSPTKVGSRKKPQGVVFIFLLASYCSDPLIPLLYQILKSFCKKTLHFGKY